MKFLEVVPEDSQPNVLSSPRESIFCEDQIKTQSSRQKLLFSHNINIVTLIFRRGGGGRKAKHEVKQEAKQLCCVLFAFNRKAKRKETPPGKLSVGCP